MEYMITKECTIDFPNSKENWAKGKTPLSEKFTLDSNVSNIDDWWTNQWLILCTCITNHGWLKYNFFIFSLY
jgi:hypothetical protein